jgi:hypothetical protein
MPFPDLAIRQLLVIRYGNDPKIVAKSENVDFELEEAAVRMAVKFGPRPAGFALPSAVFAKEINRARVAVVQVADRPDGTPNPPLAFRFLIFSRDIYAYLGDPFAIAERLPANYDARGSLEEMTWTDDAPPPRRVEVLRDILKNGDSQLFLGASQALLDGAHLVVVRPQFDTTIVRDLWQLLPDRVRCDLWPASFAFSNELNFHAAVLTAPVPGFLTDEQCKDYPEGRYELAMQIAIESGDQAEVTRLLNRSSSTAVLKLAAALIAFAFLVAAILKFL